MPGFLSNEAAVRRESDLLELVAELIDAHADTVQLLLADHRDELACAAHCDYVRALQRLGHETLSWSRRPRRGPQGRTASTASMNFLQNPVDPAELDTAIRTRRTHKAFRPEPVAGDTLNELFAVARWAPNHHVTNPWRFRVLGPRTLELLAEEAERDKPGSAHKLRRAPTLVAVSAKRNDDPVQEREDLLATGVAAYIVLLAAHTRGLAGYWRTVPLLSTLSVRHLLALPHDEEPVGLLYLGYPVQEPRVPPRAPVEKIASFLP
jgi:nitroreductase